MGCRCARVWEMVQKQTEERWAKPICFLHAKQEMDPGGGVQQSHDEVQSGHSELWLLQ